MKDTVVADDALPKQQWVDRKRYLWLFSLLAPSIGLIPSQLVLYTGMKVFWWTGPIVAFAVIPVLDALVHEDRANPPEEVLDRLSAQRYYHWCTYLFLPLLFLSTPISCWLWAKHTLSVVDGVGLALTLGLVNGIGINAAHELGHRSERYERWLSKMALAPSFYGHFYVEHNTGHHTNVATPEDPASARLGEGLWVFLPRTVLGSLRSSVSLESRRLRRTGKSFWSPRNQVLHAWAMSVVLFGLLLGILGLSILPYLVLQAAVAIFLLEAVNYIEHYGLLRAKKSNGRYERCTPRHSWNSDRVVTNIFLFHLQRHSDHHANPQRRFQALRTLEEAPQLPAGYAAMVLCAMMPPLWRRVMDHRVLAHYDGDITKANLTPRLRLELTGATSRAA